MSAAAKSLQSCPTFVMPWTAAYQAPPFVGFSRQEYCWVAIAFSSECLPRLFHVMVALGGTHLVQESHLRKAQSTVNMERQQQLENLEGEQRCLKCSLEQQRVLRTRNNTDELH